MATLQQQVQQHLDNTGISLRELAKQAGLGKSTVALVVSGRSNPSIRTRRKLQAAIRDYKPQTLDATVEQLAVQRIDADLTHVRDDALECGKQRRIAALEAEVSVWKGRATKAEALTQVYSKDLQVMQASWKAACVQAEQLQKQLDHCQQAQFDSLQAAYDQQVDDEREMLAQIDTLFVDRENAETKHDQQVMRLRMYVWILIAALVFVLVSGLVVWGGV